MVELCIFSVAGDIKENGTDFMHSVDVVPAANDDNDFFVLYCVHKTASIPHSLNWNHYHLRFHTLSNAD